jgi:hypothetical protein
LLPSPSIDAPTSPIEIRACGLQPELHRLYPQGRETQ